MKLNGRFVSGSVTTRWLKDKVKGEEEAQRLIDAYQHALAKATIDLGNAGCDPATIARILRVLGHGVGMGGIGTIEGATKELVERTGIPLPEIDPDVARYGGNPSDTGAEEIEEMLGGMAKAFGITRDMPLAHGKGVMVKGNDTVN